MSPGIPPSFDRQEKRTTLVVGGIILVAMFVASLYVVVGRSMQAHNGGGPTPGQSRLDDYLAEEERASAYAAVRNNLDRMAGQSGIAAVFCRDCSHRWIDDVIEFQGQVDFRMDSGAMESHNYTARLHGSKRDGWEVLSLEVSPVEPEATGPS